jgi:MFS family permease
MQTSIISGAFLGIIIGLFLTEQFGRKMTIVYTLGVTIVGLIIIMASVGPIMACIGLFVFGTGAEISYTLVFTVVTEIVDEEHRSKYYVYLLLFFGLGAMGNAIVFYLLSHYQLVLLFYYLIPNGVILYVFNKYVQDTPI